MAGLGGLGAFLLPEIGGIYPAILRTVARVTPAGDPVPLDLDPGAYARVRVSPDGTRLASASDDRTLRVWDTVPYRIRYQERQAILAARPEAERIVGDLLQKLNDWKMVAAQLGDDPSLSDSVRRAALNEVLRRATGDP